MNTMMKKIVGYVGLIMSLTWVSQAATRTWTNDVGDATGRFSVPANWAEGVAPVNNDLLVFGPTPTANTTLTNDLPIGTIYLNTTTFNSDAPAYTIGGNNLTGNSGTASPWTSYSFVVNSANNITQTINNNITAHQNAIGVSGSGNLTLGGTITKGGTWNPYLNMNGTGVLTLNGATSLHSGGSLNAFTINSGTVMLSKTVANNINSPVLLNGGKLMIGAPVNQMTSTLTMAPGTTYDLNGFDSGSVGLNGPLGGLVVNGAAGTGTNTLQINNNTSTSFGGTIKDGATAKIALSVGNSSTYTLFQLLSGTNTYSGGTTFNQASSGTSTLSISGIHNIGADGSRNLTFNGSGASYLQINGTGITDLSGFDSVTFTDGKRIGFDIADPANTFTISQALTNGNNGIFAKRGAGTLVLTGAATYTGATYLNGGTLIVDYQAGGSLNSATAPSFSSGATLKLLGKTSGTTAQTLGTLSANTAGGGNLLIDPNGNNFTLTLGNLTFATAGSSFLMGKALNAGSGNLIITTTYGTLTSGIYSSRAIFANGIADTGYDFATTASGGSPYTVSGYTGAILLPPSGGSGTTNYKMTGSTNLSANVAAYTLKMEAGDLALGANTLTNVAILATGTGAMQITGDPGGTGITAATELLVHQYNSGGLTIGAVIGGGIVITKSGTGTLTLSGINTYTGATYVNGGRLAITANNQLGAVATAATLNLNGGTLSTTGSFALDNASANIRPITIGYGGGGIEVVSGTLTNSGVLTANGQFVKSGAGTLVCTNTANVFNTGGVTVNDGTLLFTKANTFNNRVTVNSGTLRFSLTGNKLYGGVTLNGGTLLLDAANTIGGGVTLNGGTLLLNAANTIGGGVIINGGATLSLNNNSYVGSTALTFAGGNLQVTGTQTDPSGLNVNWDTFSGGFDITNAATIFTVTNAISGSGSLVKSGSGTLVLSGAITYSGATIISNGMLSCQYLSVTELNHYSSRCCTNLINGTGMNPNTPVRMSSTCTNYQPTMWLSAQYSTNTWVTFDLGSVQTLTGFHLWNLNESGGNMDRGIKTAGIYTNSTGLASGSLYADAGPGWVGGGLVTNMNFAMASGANSYTGSDYMFSSPVSTRYLQIYVTTNWGDAEYTGFSEIRFYYGNTNTVLANTAVSIVSDATLDIGNGSMTIKDLAGDGTIANLGSGQTLTVTGTNTFMGTITGSGALNVSGVISPAGPSVIGTNTMAQALTFSGTLEVDVKTDGSSDLLVTQGALDLTGTTLSVVNPDGLNKDKQYVILKYNSAPTGTFGGSNLPGGWTLKNDEVNTRFLLRFNTGTMIRFF